MEGIDSDLVEIRLLAPLDLAVSKIARLSDQDRDDIALLARRGLITLPALRKRAEEAMGGYIGDLDRLRGSIAIACQITEDAGRHKPAKKRRR